MKQTHFVLPNKISAKTSLKIKYYYNQVLESIVLYFSKRGENYDLEINLIFEKSGVACPCGCAGPGNFVTASSV